MKARTTLGIILGIVSMVRPPSPRARMLIMNNHHQVLLVKNWFVLGEWGLPGGGIRKKKTPKGAAIREVDEELGLKVRPASVRPLGHYATRHTYAPMQLCVYGVAVRCTVGIRTSFEIKEARWFSLFDLPQDDNGNFTKAIEIWLHGAVVK